MTDTFWGLTATGWTAITTLLTGGLLVVAVAAAFYAARQISLARQQAEEARQAAREASRPYVLVTLDPSPANNRLIGLLSPHRWRVAPGQELRVFYDSHLDRHGRTDLPTAHAVSLEYVDSSGHHYAETAALDLDALRGALSADVKTVHDIAKSVAEIQKTLKSAAVLGATRTLHVDAAVEPRSDKEERDAAQRGALQGQHARLTQMLLPGRPDPAAAGEDPPDPNDHSVP